MNCSMPGLPVYHQLPESTQTHVHWVSDAIQPSHPLDHPLLLPSIFPSIWVFSNESALHIRWPKYESFNFNVSPSNEHPGLITFRMDWLDLLAVQGLSTVFSNTIVQKHQLLSTQPSSQSNSHIHTWPLGKPSKPLQPRMPPSLFPNVGSGSWCWTGRPSVLQFMGSQRVGHDWVTELNWTESPKHEK